MAITHIEGFDLVGSNADLLAKGAAITDGNWNATAGRFGGPGYNLPTSSATVITFPGTFIRYNTVSFWWKNGAAVLGTTFILHLSDNANEPGGPSSGQTHVSIQCDAAGSIKVFGDGVSLKFTSATGVIQAQTWHHIEVRASINFSGEVRVLVDGAEVASVLADFIDGGAAIGVSFNGDADVNTLDDIVIQRDASAMPPAIGEHKIHTLLPDANTAQADWTGTVTDIDDPIGSSDGDTTFINATTLADKSEFTLGDLPESPTTIHAVQSVMEARKTDAGTKGATHYIVSNVTRENADELTASETYTSKIKVHENDPDTAAAWTEAGVNALKIGVEITT